MMRRRSVAFLLVSLLSVPIVSTAQPPELKPAAKKGESAARQSPAKPVVVKRDLEFEVSEEPYKAVFDQYNAKMLAQKYIARFTTTVAGDPEQGKSKRTEVLSELPADIRPLTALNPATGAPILAQLLENVPEEHRPAQELVEALKTDWYYHVSYWPAGMGGGGGMGGGFSGMVGGGLRFQIQAPSVEEVKQYTRAVVDLFDYGRSVPLQKALIELRGRYEAELAELRRQAAEAESAIAKLREDLEAYKDVEDLDAETLADLTTQQRLITVDLAGVKARIEACEEIRARLLKTGAPGSRIEQVETIKVTAEIEMVGLTARRDVIGEIVERARKKRDLANQRSAIDRSRRDLIVMIDDCQERIAACEELRKEAMPFRIEGKIAIQPIEWQPAKDR